MLTVHLRITDAQTYRPTPVRLRISSPDGQEFPPLGRSREFPTGRNEDVGGHLRLGRERWWYIDGTCEVPLPAGVPLRIQVMKGPEFTPINETVVLGTGQISLRLAIKRWTNSRADGWQTVDTRCHFLPPHTAWLEAQAEDIAIAHLLAVPQPFLAHDGNTYITIPNLLAFSGQTPALERDGCAVVVNTFNTHPVLGKVALLHAHRPIFPLTFGGVDATDDWSLADWCAQCHRKKGLVVWSEPFEPLGGIIGGEALVAALLGHIDALEVTGGPRKNPLLPWVYRLWDAGLLLPLVGASGKESNQTPVGAMRTYVRGPSWIAGIRAGQTFVTAGPLLTLAHDGERVRASAQWHGDATTVEIVANGQVIASGRGEVEATVLPGWVAARCTQPAFAHTSAIPIGSPAPPAAAVAVLQHLIEQTREWIATQGRFTQPQRQQTLLARCQAAVQRLTTPHGADRKT
ncbi:MAG: hypothetical protein RMJ56_18040 [Gemmataceae bacterium]|nr:hypothetical protein [Gemmata sp.]MDW8199497.1 hypothetical protein [Gemmataceae bacterium]